MNSKLSLVLALGLAMAFSEGCAIQIPGMGFGGGLPQQSPFPLGPVAQAPGTTGSPLDGSLAAGLPQGATGYTDPGFSGAGPTFTPAAPSSTPAAIPNPNATTPAVAAAGTTPSVVPVGNGPIDPSTLPQIPAADPAGTATLVSNPVAPTI